MRNNPMVGKASSNGIGADTGWGRDGDNPRTSNGIGAQSMKFDTDTGA